MASYLKSFGQYEMDGQKWIEEVFMKWIDIQNAKKVNSTEMDAILQDFFSGTRMCYYI